jgi:DNA-binding NtrC family response regulator
MVVDDDAAIRRFLRELLAPAHEVIEASSARLALRAIREQEPDVVLLDLDLGDGPDGFVVLDAVRSLDAELPVVVVSHYSDTDTVVRAMRAGASHYIGKTPRFDELGERIRLAVEERRRRLDLEAHRGGTPQELIGSSPAMTAVRDLVAVAARSDMPVLVFGETGVGKGLVAGRIHRASSRSRGPYLEINIASLPATMLDSELFGHERGAFTGAEKRHRGMFELAQRGTILLDEIGDLVRECQVKLLRVLDARRFRRLGGEKDLVTDARVVAATHQDLTDMVDRGLFRADLYHRLAGLIIEIPPLRARRSDIIEIARSFLGPSVRLRPAAEAALLEHEWPGNVRELQQTLRRASLLASGPLIDRAHIQLPSRRLGKSGAWLLEDFLPLPYHEAVRALMGRFQRCYLEHWLEREGGNISEAARATGLSRAHIHALIGELELRPPTRMSRRSGSVARPADDDRSERDVPHDLP